MTLSQRLSNATASLATFFLYFYRILCCRL